MEMHFGERRVPVGDRSGISCLFLRADATSTITLGIGSGPSFGYRRCRRNKSKEQDDDPGANQGRDLAGASRGIGAAVAERLAADGFAVVISYSGTVNAVAPGPTATDPFLNGKSEELMARMAKMNPLQRPGTPEDIALSWR
jgi:hypothetical protein